MTQTSAIAGSLIIAFVVFVTVRGELPCYMQVLGIATDAQCPIGSPGGTPTAGAGFLPGGGGGPGVNVGGCATIFGIPICGNSGGNVGVVLPPINIGGGFGGGSGF